jgi:hypothetical protein
MRTYIVSTSDGADHEVVAIDADNARRLAERAIRRGDVPLYPAGTTVLGVRLADGTWKRTS